MISLPEPEGLFLSYWKKIEEDRNIIDSVTQNVFEYRKRAEQRQQEEVKVTRSITSNLEITRKKMCDLEQRLDCCAKKIDREDAKSEADQVGEDAQSTSPTEDNNRATKKRKLCTLTFKSKELKYYAFDSTTQLIFYIILYSGKEGALQLKLRYLDIANNIRLIQSLGSKLFLYSMLR